MPQRNARRMPRLSAAATHGRFHALARARRERIATAHRTAVRSRYSYEGVHGSFVSRARRRRAASPGALAKARHHSRTFGGIRERLPVDRAQNPLLPRSKNSTTRMSSTTTPTHHRGRERRPRTRPMITHIDLSGAGPNAASSRRRSAPRPPTGLDRVRRHHHLLDDAEERRAAFRASRSNASHDGQQVVGLLPLRRHCGARRGEVLQGLERRLRHDQRR